MDTVNDVTERGGKALAWTVLAVRLPREPSRHRVAVWRELRRSGALALGQGVWAAPSTPAFEESLERAVTLSERGEGEVLLLHAQGVDPEHAERLRRLFTDGREAEWLEFLSECGKYEAELDEEIRQKKFTVAELDEEEQSLERLRRWYRELKVRDVFGAPSAAAAEGRLRESQARLEDFADRVYGAVHEH